MKKVYELVLVIVSLLLIGGSFAHGQTEDYFDDSTPAGKLDSKIPNFNHTHVAILFDGPIAFSLKQRLESMGAKVAIGEKGTAACELTHPVVCIDFAVNAAVKTSSYGTSSGYGARGSSYNQSSLNGSLSPVTVSVVLFREDGNPVVLAQATAIAVAGTSTESFGGFNVRGGGMTTTTTTSGLDGTLGNVVNLDIRKLFDSGLKGIVLASNLRSCWVPGADRMIAQAFPPAPTPQR